MVDFRNRSFKVSVCKILFNNLSEIGSPPPNSFFVVNNGNKLIVLMAVFWVICK